jgi:hypothetical protein
VPRLPLEELRRDTLSGQKGEAIMPKNVPLILVIISTVIAALVLLGVVAIPMPLIPIALILTNVALMLQRRK